MSRVVTASNCGKGSDEGRDAGNNENSREACGEGETKTLAKVLIGAVKRVSVIVVAAVIAATIVSPAVVAAAVVSSSKAVVVAVLVIVVMWQY